MKSIQRKLGTLRDRLQRLDQVAQKAISFQDYQKSLDKKDVAERNLQIAIETCLDIGKIIISLKQLSEPKDNKDIFVVLAEAKVISKDSLKFLVPMAGTRNILVHGYDKIDDSLMYGIIKNHLKDFHTFIDEVKSFK